MATIAQPLPNDGTACTLSRFADDKNMGGGITTSTTIYWGLTCWKAALQRKTWGPGGQEADCKPAVS